MANGDRHGYFWPSNDGDRIYGADSFEKWLKKFFSTGVYADDCQVTAAGGMSVQVGTGYSNINGKVRVIDEAETLTLSPANSRYPRIDSIVIRRDETNRTIETAVVTGAYSGINPEPQAPTRNQYYYEIVLAHIYVAAGVVEITQANITDKREDTTVCGYITSPFESLDFTQIVAQMEAQFDEWFDYMKGQLSEDAAGRLQQEIDALTARIDGMTTGGSVFEVYTQEPTLYYQPVTITSPRGTVYHGQFDENGKAVISGVTDVGQMTIATTDGTQTATRTRDVTYYSNYSIYINFFQATITVTTTSSDLIGQTVTATKDGGSQTAVFDANGSASFIVRSAGTYTLSVTSDGQTYTTTATVTTDGSTVTATLNSWNATVNITAQESFYEQPVLIYKSGVYVKTVTLSNAGTASVAIHESGTYTFTSYADGTEQVDIELNVASQTTYTINFTYERTYIFGFQEVESTSSPGTTTVYYPQGVDNYGWTKATWGSAGSWTNFLTDILQNKPAMVKADGTVDYYLDPTDYSKKADGTASDYNNASYSGAGAFAWIKNLWTKTVWDGTTRFVYFSNKQVDNTYSRMIPNGKEGYWLPMGLSNTDTNPKSLISGNAYGTQIDGYSVTFNIPTLANNTKFFGGAIKNALRDIYCMMFRGYSSLKEFAAIKGQTLVGNPYQTGRWVHQRAGQPGHITGYRAAIIYTNDLLADTTGGLPGFKTRTQVDGTNDGKMFHSQVLPKLIYDNTIDADSLYAGTLRTSEDYGVTFTDKAQFTKSFQTIGTARTISETGKLAPFYGAASYINCGAYGTSGSSYDFTSNGDISRRMTLIFAQGADTGAEMTVGSVLYQSTGATRRAYSSIGSLGVFHDKWNEQYTEQGSSGIQFVVQNAVMGLYTAITVIPPNDYQPAA